LVAYQTAYFKANYPQEFLAALLTSVMGNSDKVGLYIEECRRMKLSILHPDVNSSGPAFTPEGEAIRFGLMGIKNVGLGAIEKIVQERQQAGPYRNLADFCNRVGSQLVNRKVLESLIRAGALDFTGVGRNPLLAMLEQLTEKGFRTAASVNQLNLLDVWDEPVAPMPEVPDFAPAERLRQEKEYLGVYLSGHPLDAWQEKFRENAILPLAELEEDTEAVEGKEVLIGGVATAWRSITTKAGSTMASFRLEDLTGAIEIIVFPKLYEKVAADYRPERVVIVKGRFQEEERGKKVLAAQLRWLGE
ncbi:MAG TPA: OB-fold nucleic acid binding domain-containing protein, partial [Bacillota bacterium]|nr:OB-fold nucleic acid binding domain-containing protein [Bacillota bacterium]